MLTRNVHCLAFACPKHHKRHRPKARARRNPRPRYIPPLHARHILTLWRWSA